MAMTYGDATYGNALRKLTTDPSSFAGSPGFKFALNTGLDATSRNSAASGMRGSGNALAALAKYGTGLAQQDYGNEFDRLLRANSAEQGYDTSQTGNANTLTLGHERNANDLTLGTQANTNTATRNANDLTLGTQANANTATRNANDFSLGSTRNANDFSLGSTRNANDLTLGLGGLANTATRNANDFTLGMGQNANNAQRNSFDYDLGLRTNATNNSRNQNDFNLGMFNGQTNRGNALADIYFRNRAANPPSYWAGGGYVQPTPRY